MTRYLKLAATVALASLLIASLEACGRRGDPHPPEGEEENYNFPAFYPNWEDTLAPRRGDVEETVEAGAEGKEPPPTPLRKKPDTTFRLEDDGYSRSRTTTY